jgi:adenosylhomocysteine nucleosidase
MQRADVAFLVAMTEEIEGIFDLGRWVQSGTAPFETYEYAERPGGGVIVHTGIGTTNAAAAAQFTLDRFGPRRIVNLGLVGCLDTGIAIGTVCSVETCAFFDVDATVFGYKIGQIPRTSVTEYELAGRVAGVPRARLISGDTFVTDPGVFHPDLVGFAADFVDMELAAIAHTLYRNDALGRLESYKSPSDYCNDASTDAFDVNMPKALANLAAVAREVLRGGGDEERAGAGERDESQGEEGGFW